MLFSIKKIIGIILVIFFISFIIESPFRKGGISPNSQLIIIILIFGLSLIYSFQSKNKDFSKIQKVIQFLSVILSTGIGLVFSSMINHILLEKLYGLDFRLFLNETASNLLFLNLAFLISGLIIEVLNNILQSYNNS